MRKLLLLLSIVLLAGCSPNTLIEKLADQEKQRIALGYIQRIVTDDPTTLLNELDPSLDRNNARAGLVQLQSLFPKQTPTVANLVGYNVIYSSSEGVGNHLTYQLGYGSKWLLVYVSWRDRPGKARELITLKAQPINQSLQEANAFSFRHVRGRHVFFLCGALLVPLFILTTLLVCIQTKIARRKWLWILIVLVGMVQFSINWSTGEMTTSPVAFLLFGSSAMAASIYSPWIISVTIPVGAILFWFKRKSLTAPSMSSH